MIQKINKGRGFRGAVNYVLGKKDARLIGGTMAGTTPRELAREAGAIRRLNPKLGRAVLHVALSLPPGEWMDDEQWLAFIERYMRPMGFENAPYIVVRHHDTDHDHVHIVALRIDTKTGKTISESNDFKRGERILRCCRHEYMRYWE